MARAKKPTIQKKPPLAVHTVTLTPDVSEMLQLLSRDATDFLGRSISNSAIVRGLIRQVMKEGPSAADALFVEVEKELKGGVMWGKKK